MEYAEFRRMESTKMQALCIKHNWYNAGTNEEYRHLLFELCGYRNLSTADVSEIVNDIIAHTAEFRDVTDYEMRAAIVHNVSVEVFKNMSMWLVA